MNSNLTGPRRYCGWRILLWAVGVWSTFPTAAAISVEYQKDIRPILQQRCYACHSRLKQKSNLRLDAGALILKGGKEGAAVTPGDSAASLLLKRVSSADESERMPSEGRPLSAEQITLLKRWIDEGARYPREEPIPPLPGEHWAFQPVRRPLLPAVKNRLWSRNPIDRFVLAKLESRGWRPSPDAPPRALLRRTYLDLIGLPPTLAEQSAFLSAPDDTAFRRVIDDLLA